MSNTQRTPYLDCFRALPMIMVVFCHVEMFCLNRVHNLEIIAYTFNIIQLPIFFFISGWFANNAHKRSFISKRFKNMLVPTFLMFLLFVGYIEGEYRNLTCFMMEEYKHGYWFPFVLFIINSLHHIVERLRCKISLSSLGTCVLCFSFYAFLVVFVCIEKVNGWHVVSNLLCLRLVMSALPFYVIGYFCKLHIHEFHAIIERKRTSLMIMLMFPLCIVFNKLYPSFVLKEFIGVLGTMGVYKLCYSYRRHLMGNGGITSCLVKIGRSTLNIYLIHYFFIFCSFFTYRNVSDIALVPMAVVITIFVLSVSMLSGYVFASLKNIFVRVALSHE